MRGEGGGVLFSSVEWSYQGFPRNGVFGGLHERATLIIFGVFKVLMEKIGHGMCSTNSSMVISI